MARNASSKKAKEVEPEYTLGYDADGNVVLVPVTRDTSPARSPFSRISEGAMEGYGYQPLGMSEKDIAEYPNAARYLNPIAKALDAVRRAPGAVAGGLAGTAGAGAELWTGDRGVANEAQRAVASALEYGGNQSMATMGGPRPSANIPRNGEVLPPERGGPRQLGYTERPIVDVRRELPPGSIRAGSAEGLPRLTYEDPLSRYRLSSEQGQRVGPNRPSEAFRPVIDEMYTVPGQLNRTPETTTPSSVARLGDESPMQAERAGASRAAYEEFLADLRAADEARATNEGMREPGTRSPPAPVEAPAPRPMTAPALPEGNVPAWQARPAPGIRRAAPAEAPSPAQPTFDFGGPQSVGGQMVDPLTGRAWMPRRFDLAAPQSATGSFSPVTRAEAVIPQRPVDLNALLNEPRASIPPERPRISTGDDLINQAIADVTSQAPAGAAVTPRTTFGLRQRAPVTGEGAARPAATAEAPLSAEEIASLRKNGFDDVADQVEAAQARQAASAAPPAPAAATQGPSSGPWGPIPQPSKGLPPGSTYTPFTPAASVSGLPTPKSWTLTDTALGAGSLGVLGAVADRQERRQKKEIGAATERQRIDDMEDAALAASRGRNAQDYSQFSEYGDPTKMFEGNYANFQRYGSPKPPAQSQRPEYMSGNAPAQQRSAPAAPAGGGSILDKIFSGKDYQSSGGQLQQQQGGNRVLNWGDSDNAADFFRAAAMQRKLQDQGQDFTGASGSDIDYSNRMAGDGKARGGAAEQKPSKEAMLHKSLEIIHHMIKNR